MKSNYKPLGNYIKQIKKKNKDGSVSVLKGIRINKEFMESVANIQGTDLSKYRVVEKYQFAYNPMHVGRDEILPISVLLEDEPIIVSPAYVVFEILDHNELDPEYLMMWCRRSEFDRNVWFTTDSSVRGGFSWESLCELELPIPSIEKQREIVAEYNTIINRIKLNETLNQKLEDTAQALYKHWFVDFEFPNAEGKPYRSSGGEMVYNDELDVEIPLGWDVKDYEQVFSFKTGKLNSNAALEDGKYPFFTCSSETFKTDTYSFDCEALLLAGNNASAVYPFKYYKGKFDAYQRTYVIFPLSEEVSIYQGYFEVLSQLEGFKGTSSGTATKFLTMKILNPLKLIVPELSYSIHFNYLMKPFFYRILLNEKTIANLHELKDLLLSKMSKVETKTVVV